MLNKVMNGYTIIAAEHDPKMGDTVILGMRYTGPGKWDYVTARVTSIDDTEWYWGNYSGTDFGSGIECAVYNWRCRLEA